MPAPAPLSAVPAGARKKSALKKAPPPLLNLKSGGSWVASPEETLEEEPAWLVALKRCARACAGYGSTPTEAAEREVRELASRWGALWLANPLAVELRPCKKTRRKTLASALMLFSEMQTLAQARHKRGSRSSRWCLAGEPGWRAADFAPLWEALAEQGALPALAQLPGAREVGSALMIHCGDSFFASLRPQLARALFADAKTAEGLLKDPGESLIVVLEGALSFDGAEIPELCDPADQEGLIDYLSALAAREPHWFATAGADRQSLAQRLARSPVGWASDTQIDRLKQAPLWSALARAFERALSAGLAPKPGSEFDDVCARICSSLCELREGQGAVSTWTVCLSMALERGFSPSGKDEFKKAPLAILGASGMVWYQESDDAMARLEQAAAMLLQAGAGAQDLVSETAMEALAKLSREPVKRVIQASLERDALLAQIDPNRLSEEETRLAIEWVKRRRARASQNKEPGSSALSGSKASRL